MLKLAREQYIALACLGLVLVLAIGVPWYFLSARSDALQDVTDRRDMLDRLEAAHKRTGQKGGVSSDHPTPAPTEAFVNAPTVGLATAQLEDYLSKLSAGGQASLVSSGVQQTNHVDAADVLRVQFNLELPYDALQAFLYKLETGTPYVFVDAMTLQPNATVQNGGRPSQMKLTLTLRALWHRTPA